MLYHVMGKQSTSFEAAHLLSLSPAQTLTAHKSLHDNIQQQKTELAFYENDLLLFN